MLIEHNKSLRQLNTFRIESIARAFASFSNEPELRDLLDRVEGPYCILGGGSNILLPPQLDKWVLWNRIEGIEIQKEEEDAVLVRAGAGVQWHHLVTWAVDRGFGGIENLALIPGTVGAAPIQNIGAYGVELKDVFVNLEALPRSGGPVKIFSNQACNFGYRDSIFKGPQRESWVILFVTLRLTKQPRLKLDYGDIRQVLRTKGINEPDLRDVYQAVIDIRSSKLPDPANIGNAGSFFKNPVISTTMFTALKRQWPDLPGYPQDDHTVKVPAGWLIERSGWKGYRSGDAGIHQLQALVLVNYGQATSEQLISLAHKVAADIKGKFGIMLEPEVNIIS